MTLLDKSFILQNAERTLDAIQRQINFRTKKNLGTLIQTLKNYLNDAPTDTEIVYYFENIVNEFKLINNWDEIKLRNPKICDLLSIFIKQANTVLKNNNQSNNNLPDDVFLKILSYVNKTNREGFEFSSQRFFYLANHPALKSETPDFLSQPTIKTITLPKIKMDRIALSPSEKYIAGIHIWQRAITLIELSNSNTDLVLTECKNMHDIKGFYTAVIFSLDNEFVIGASSYGSIEVWEVKSKELKYKCNNVFKDDSQARLLALKNGHIIIGVDYDIYQFDYKKNTTKFLIKTQTLITQMRLSANEEFLICHGNPQFTSSVDLYTLKTDTVQLVKFKEINYLKTLIPIQNGKRFICEVNNRGKGQNHIFIKDIFNSKSVGKNLISTEDKIQMIDISYDEKFLFLLTLSSITDKNIIIIFNIKECQIIKEFELDQQTHSAFFNLFSGKMILRDNDCLSFYRYPFTLAETMIEDQVVDSRRKCTIS